MLLAKQNTESTEMIRFGSCLYVSINTFENVLHIIWIYNCSVSQKSVEGDILQSNYKTHMLAYSFEM